MGSSSDLDDFRKEGANRLQAIIMATSFLFGHQTVVSWVMNHSALWLSSQTAFEIQRRKSVCAKTEPLSHPAPIRKTAMNRVGSSARTHALQLGPSISWDLQASIPQISFWYKISCPHRQAIVYSLALCKVPDYWITSFLHEVNRVLGRSYFICNV